MRTHRFSTFNSALLGTAYCVFAAMANGQTAPPNRGVLLRQQTPTLLQSASTCKVAGLQLIITTGNDDLRGGNNNLNVEIHYANGDMQTATNVNKGAPWANQSVKAVGIQLKQPVAPNQIKQIRLIHSASGSYTPPDAGQIGITHAPVVGPMLTPIYAAEGVHTEDNWDMAQLQAFAMAKGINIPIASSGFHKFTGTDPSFDINANPGVTCATGNRVTHITFTFVTADDDLRGGNDNINLTILFTDGTSQAASNINHSQNWPNGSTKGADVLLSRSVTIDQIRGFTLEDTFIGGPAGDNWKMASMEADAFLSDGSFHTIAKSGFHRFSADWSGDSAKQITIPAHQIN
ncbi:MAG TPA: hypothetical protein VFA90_11180 [Terriglobales bacterium]|nr:hypothetical protein [Terriglobales bacterium]